MQKEYLIIHVDDDEDDLSMLKGAFQSLGRPFNLVQENNGEDCLKTLQRLAAEGTLPCLVVLDINMPKMDGKQTFSQIKKNPALATIPIVIFSTSNSVMDKLFFKGKNVEYMVKPINVNVFTEIAQHMLSICEE